MTFSFMYTSALFFSVSFFFFSVICLQIHRYFFFSVTTSSALFVSVTCTLTLFVFTPLAPFVIQFPSFFVQSVPAHSVLRTRGPRISEQAYAVPFNGQAKANQQPGRHEKSVVIPRKTVRREVSEMEPKQTEGDKTNRSVCFVSLWLLVCFVALPAMSPWLVCSDSLARFVLSL